MPDSKGLGWIPGPEDPRDKPLGAALGRLGIQRTSGSRWWYGPPPVLDQGREGACTGFGATHMVNASPRIKHYTNEDARQVYYRARQIDEWPGENYDGSSVRAAMKAAQEKGWISSYAFAQDAKEAALWILNRGTIVIGIDWYESMYDAALKDKYYIKLEGDVVGGHAICVDGVRYLEGGTGGDWVRLRNSWGSDYGYFGRCRLSFADFEKLLSEPYAVAATSTEV